MKLARQFAALLVILMAGFAIYGYGSFSTLNQLKVNGPVYQRIIQGKDLIADILPPPEYIIESYLVVLQTMSAAPDERQTLFDKLKTLKADYDTRRAYWLNESLEDALKNPMNDADKSAQAFYELAFTQWIPALDRQDSAEVGAAFTAMQAHYALHRSAIDQVVELATKRNAADEASAKTQAETAFSIMLATLLIVTAVAAAMLWLLARNLLRQLGGEPSEAVSVAQHVGAGNLNSSFSLRQGDSSSLMAQLKLMQEGLRSVVTQVRQGSERVASASVQIAQSNNDLSVRTEQQASALEQTTASMEELSATVNQNVDSARQANQLALTASAVAIKGGKVVAQVVDTMQGINDASRKISEIISVIDGIAFQTNILALNAAVEAARAGEQGRGFAVVASEVRSLAGRSAEAAKEIKSLIGASVQRVDQGSALVGQAGVTMTEVVSSIKRVTDIMGEISAASSEQSLGVAQVGAAVSQMDQATQQNAALVHEMTAAASSLQGQAQDLVQTVAVFNLAGQADIA
ncbi:methyl-accepting chemotaxis protein [Rhodoferax antarcticus]|uniref:Methyl-accepting chemotaxis sensory transducer n=1 Tax=Rhodoferax antarcticus ANT.BR TaxID=1111071 RepID=A0A1Q8YHA0_9BURK|nr:methyl-accepting chemotaxis protein [Rhodoferax antarcticus]APW45143.1 methyl-accepting chemotaxis protein [Rhodoferax antarcticus]OLP07383.1 Methyl-accepting chemotaxis sensory transducer [Rhodoferax antarcticus ANT.BR]